MSDPRPFLEHVGKTISMLVRNACKTDPGDEIAAAYDAPFPEARSKQGARAFLKQCYFRGTTFVDGYLANTDRSLDVPFTGPVARLAERFIRPQPTPEELADPLARAASCLDQSVVSQPESRNIEVRVRRSPETRLR